MMQFDETHNVSPTMQHSPAILRKGVLHFVRDTRVSLTHHLFMNCNSYARLLLLVLWTIILSLHICELFTLRLRRQPLPWKNRPRSRGLVTARLPDAQARSRQRGAVSKAHPTVKVCLHANTSIGTSTRHVWAQTTQAQAQTRVPFPCDCACVVRVHTWLMLALVLASYL